MFRSLEKASPEQKASFLNDSSVIILVIYKIGSHTGFESASGSHGFCTRMRVCPALGQSLGRSDDSMQRPTNCCFNSLIKHQIRLSSLLSNVILSRFCYCYFYNRDTVHITILLCNHNKPPLHYQSYLLIKIHHLFTTYQFTA